METINISSLKKALSEVLRKVRLGEAYTVLDRDIPVAKISKYESSLAPIFSAQKGKVTAPKPLEREIFVDVVGMLREDRNRR